MYEKIKLDYSSLDPYITEKTIYINYYNYYGNYIDNLNKLLIKNNYDYIYSMEELIDRIDMFNLEDRDDILYNLMGSLNHELFFYTMSPYGKNKPIGNIKNKIEEEFGTYDKFREEFIKKALELKGSGYTFLVVNDSKLQIINTSVEDSVLLYGFIPLLVIDMWEHAYYLDYEDNKLDYINNWFKLIDFEKVEKIYNKK